MLHHPSKQIHNAFICEKHFSNNFFIQKTKLHKYALPSIFLREDKQTSINNVRPAEQIENSTITENPTVENLILPVMPKVQNRHPTKSSSVLQVLECKKVSSLTSKGRNIYYMDRYQRKTISKLKNLLHDSKIISEILKVNAKSNY
jgi:hypothetical protein